MQAPFNISFITINKNRGGKDTLVIRTDLPHTERNPIVSFEPTDIIIHVDAGYGEEWAKKAFGDDIELRIF